MNKEKGRIMWSERFQMEGTLKQGAWTDSYDVAVPVDFNVPVTPALIEKAKIAFLNSKHFKPTYGGGPALRTFAGRSFKEVSKGNDGLVFFIITETWSLYD
jgi:hypothetical protein